MKITPPNKGGKGWGDGSVVRQFNRSRTHNPLNTYTGFRPRVGEVEGAYFVIKNWCDDSRICRSFSAIINSLLIPLSVACVNTTEVDADGNISIEVNLGRVIIK